MKPILRTLRPLIAVIALCWIGHAAAASQKQDDAADAQRLIEVLELRPGSTVADVGAGSGPLTVLMARHVGPSGRVYATDINADRLAELRKAAASASLSNVTVLEGRETETNLPDACCDAIFMRLVYHHFGDPPAMNASLMRSLKPGGRIAVVDFAPKRGDSAPPGKRADGDAHGVTPATVIEELKAAGFVDVGEQKWTPPGFLVIGRRPAAPHPVN